MKKVLSLLSVAILFALASCGKSGETKAIDNSTNNSSEQVRGIKKEEETYVKEIKGEGSNLNAMKELKENVDKDFIEYFEKEFSEMTTNDTIIFADYEIDDANIMSVVYKILNRNPKHTNDFGDCAFTYFEILKSVKLDSTLKYEKGLQLDCFTKTYTINEETGFSENVDFELCTKYLSTYGYSSYNIKDVLEEYKIYSQTNVYTETYEHMQLDTSLVKYYQANLK